MSASRPACRVPVLVLAALYGSALAPAAAPATAAIPPTPATPAAPAVEPLGRRVFVDSRHPPFYRQLDDVTEARAELGHAVFNTRWVRAGTPNAARRDGLGPLFNAGACDACHNEGARGRGPDGDGPAPDDLVINLLRPVRAGQPAAGDPRYGYVLNTAALPGLAPEGAVTIHYRTLTGRYPDGGVWTLRDPQYVLSALRYGPLSPHTVLSPRLPPALFGDGLLQAVPQTAITGAARRDGTAGAALPGVPAWQWLGTQRVLGRFGWQGASVSIRDQTTKAFAREMGLTSSDRPHDDCTAVETDCLAQPSGGNPEVSDQLLDAVVEFQRWLAVPILPGTPAASPVDPLFVQIGCAACHRPRLPVDLPAPDGTITRGVITPYTDLRLHDLGRGLADVDATGRKVPTLWRTAPLWMLGYRLQREHQPTFLHDGRARSIEEAILWHGGEARAARDAFERLSARRRAALLHWLATL